MLFSASPLPKSYFDDGNLTQYKNNITAHNDCNNAAGINKRCDCCPYGFHIDLDFVKFAEDISTGKEQVQKWSGTPNSKRTRHYVTPPFSISFYETANGNEATSASRSASAGGHYGTAISAASGAKPYLTNLSTSSSPPPYLSSYQEYMPSSILKNSSNRSTPLGDARGPVISPTSFVRFTTPDNQQRQHQSRLRQFEQQQQEHASGHHVINPLDKQRSFSIAQSLLSTSAPAPMARSLPSAAFELSLPSSFRTSALSKPHEEQRHKLSATSKYIVLPTKKSSISLRNHTINNNNNRNGGSCIDRASEQGFTSNKHIMSAPTSPVPKTFRTAVAQSMSQLKNLPSITGTNPPVPFHSSANWNAGITGRDVSTTVANTTANITETRAVYTPQFNYYNQIFPMREETATTLSGVSSPWTMTAEERPNWRRSQILSPEPDAQRATGGLVSSPMALRTSNLQSRSYFHNNNNVMPSHRINHTSATLPNSSNVDQKLQDASPFAYRSIGANGTATTSSQFNLDSFASVRRPKNRNNEKKDAICSSYNKTDLTSSPKQSYAGDCSNFQAYAFTTTRQFSPPCTAFVPYSQKISPKATNGKILKDENEPVILPNILDDSATTRHTDALILTSANLSETSIMHDISESKQQQQQKEQSMRSAISPANNNNEKNMTTTKNNYAVPHSPPPILYNVSTQTVKSKKKFYEIGTETDPQLFSQFLQTNLEKFTHTNSRAIGTDTLDLLAQVSPTTKVIAAKNTAENSTLLLSPKLAAKPKLTLEFQFCLGHEPEHEYGYELTRAVNKVARVDCGTDPIKWRGRDKYQQTTVVSLASSSSNTENVKVNVRDQHVQACDFHLETPTQSAQAHAVSVNSVGVQTARTQERGLLSTSAQTDSDKDCLQMIFEKQSSIENKDDAVKRRAKTLENELDENVEERRRSADKVTETDEEGASEFILVTCPKCENSSSFTSSSAAGFGELYEKIPDPDEKNESKTIEIDDDSREESQSPVYENLRRNRIEDDNRVRSNYSKVEETALENSAKNRKEDFEAVSRPDDAKAAKNGDASEVISNAAKHDLNRRKSLPDIKITTTTLMLAKESSVRTISSPSVAVAENQKQSSPFVLAHEQPPHPDLHLDALSNFSNEQEFDSDRISIDTDVQTIIMIDNYGNGTEGTFASCSPRSISVDSESTITSDTVSIATEVSGSNSQQRLLDPSSAEAIRKLLTEPQRRNSAPLDVSTTNSAGNIGSGFFQRDASNYRSYRIERSKPDDLDYIADRHTNKNDSNAEPSTPASASGPSQDTALKAMVVLKKAPLQAAQSASSFVGPLTSNNATVTVAASLPDPIPARIPRPKYFTKYSSLPSSSQVPETPDEEAEAADHVAPLRSEMRSLAWSSSRRFDEDGYKTLFRGQRLNRQSLNHYDGNRHEEDLLYDNNDDDDQIVFQEDDFLDDEDDELEELDDATKRPTSRSSADGGAQSDATYEMSETESGETAAIYFENEDAHFGSLKLSEALTEALQTLNARSNSTNASMLAAFSSATDTHTDDSTDPVSWAAKFVRHEWLKLSTKRTASAQLVDAFVSALRERFSPALMKMILNLTDQNGNTALHYAVSHENYDVVSALLDAKACDVDAMNRAGYSAVMLGALCEVRSGAESAIIHRLFHVGNVNAKAVKHSQTALMLAASHGRIETTQLLLNCGADVNIQDVDGSTALMCAAEHGQKEIVKILLKRPSIDASLTDCDNQTALSIAVENQHRDIGVIIYAHLNFSRLEQNDNSVAV